ncbi:MAG: UDP-N-acetylglucosamine 2-epimerase (non-hydrolyzing) [Planctomycetes bacterium]|nr:UDP-N-acetylglucosamine 2-epimerase (non-hydrolyzing) [Planctomycetota bacterium]
MRFVTIVGARPQFIKAAPLCAHLRRRHDEFLVHTGQHYDDNMSKVFFQELAIPEPDRHLGVGSAPHGRQTAAMLEQIEQVLEETEPDAVIVYGDTNSTLAGALAAAKMNVPVAHVEAGLRSFNRNMPEEVNRILSDHVCKWLFATSQTSVDQLAAEGIRNGVHNVGDIMADCVRLFSPKARSSSNVLSRLRLQPGTYAVATVHRAENTDAPERLSGILDGLRKVPYPVIFPMHPRTRAAIRKHGIDFVPDDGTAGADCAKPDRGIVVVEPLGYLDMLLLQQRAAVVLTDSGGVQKEAYYLGVPCVTLREETEWVETVETGWNRLVGSDPEKIVAAVQRLQVPPPGERPMLYGDGHAAERIVDLLERGLCENR